MRVSTTTFAVMPLLLALPLQSKCSPPPLAGVISLYDVDGTCVAKATDVVVPDIKQPGSALWLVTNLCSKAVERRITVGEFRVKGQSGYFDVVDNCLGIAIRKVGNPPVITAVLTTDHVALWQGETGLLRCDVRPECAPEDDFASYKYGVCADGTFIRDPDLRVKGGNRKPSTSCRSISKAEADALCSKSTTP